MKTYTFSMGGVDRWPGLYISWLLDAASEEEAVEKSREAFEPSSGGSQQNSLLEPVEADHASPGATEALIVRVSPDYISADLIIDEVEAVGADGPGQPTELPGPTKES